MKILFAVKSCQKDMREGCHQAIRETWGKGFDVRFFVGGDACPLESDETRLPVPDDYWTLTPKTKGICAYMVDCHYDYVYLCDTDTYLEVPDLVMSGFQKYDFSGGHLCQTEPGQEFGKPYAPWTTDRGGVADPFYVYLSGGVGFFLSRRAAAILYATYYYHHSEDVWVGQVLGPLIERGYIRAGLLDVEGKCAWHLNCGFYGGNRHPSERLSPAEAVRRKYEMESKNDTR